MKKKAITNPHIEKLNFLKIKTVTGITVNEITTRKERIKQIVKKYEPVTESMEGAALHYVCRHKLPVFCKCVPLVIILAKVIKAKWKIKESLA